MGNGDAGSAEPEWRSADDLERVKDVAPVSWWYGRTTV